MKIIGAHVNLITLYFNYYILKFNQNNIYIIKDDNNGIETRIKEMRGLASSTYRYMFYSKFFIL